MTRSTKPKAPARARSSPASAPKTPRSPAKVVAKAPPKASAPRAKKEPAKTPRERAALLAEIRDLERELDRLILARDAEPEVDEPESEAPLEASSDPVPVPVPVPESSPPPATPIAPVVPVADASGPLPSHEPDVASPVREIVGAEFYRKKWGREALRNRTEDVDPFGYDPTYDAKLRPVLEFLYSRWFRVETVGIANVPAEGRAILVANHSGTVPFDGVMLKTAVLLEHARARHLRWLTEDFIQHFPFLGGAMNRLGAVRACQENAERLLASEELVAVFPEGQKGIGKLFADRYRLQRFGRGGFVKLALRSRAPLVPVAIVGAEETNPLLFRIEYLSKALGLPYVPVTPTFPALGPLGLLPAPTKWRIVIGEPIDLGGHGEADDELLVGRIADRVRATIQGMLDRELASRKSVFFG